MKFLQIPITGNSSNQASAIVNNSEAKKETAISEEVATTTSNSSTNISNENLNTSNNAITNTIEGNSLGNTATTTSANNTISKETQEYFSASRLNRETMYSQMIDSYQKILESQTISETQKAIAQTEIQKINSTKNKIMICENLIKTKGFNDLVIFVNDKSISVVVRANNLEQEQIAQIQNIIAREMNAEVSDIHISNR